MSIEHNATPGLAGRLQERYKILAKLGSGGMANVFLAMQLGEQDFQRLVVIKRIHSSWLNKNDALKMFIDEARTIASLNHPHIVKIYDLSKLEKDICIAMEYVNGENLFHILQSVKNAGRCIPLPVLCALIAQASDALHHAHTACTPHGKPLHLIHRDISLSNLMIDVNGYIKVIDFGIAKSSTQNEMTSPGVLKGKFSYLAPDYFKHKNIDNRVDLYALGLVFYEMLTQKKAFSFGPDVTVAQVIQTLFETDLPPPSSLVADLPSWMDELVMKAIDKDRERRYQSGKEFAADIRSCAERIGGLDTVGDIADWFHTEFKDRIAKRREFERRALERARRLTTNSGVDTTNLPSVDITASINEIGDISAGSTTTTRISRINPYFFLVLIFLLFISGAWLWSVIFGEKSTPLPSHPPAPREHPVQDNLLVHSEPTDAEILINHRKVGTTQPNGTVLAIKPGKEHQLLVRKNGYLDYQVNVTGLTNGRQIILAKLTVSPSTTNSKLKTFADQPSAVVVKRTQIKSSNKQSGIKKSNRSKTRSHKTSGHGTSHANLRSHKPRKVVNPIQTPRIAKPKPKAKKTESDLSSTPPQEKPLVPLLEEDHDLLPVRPGLQNEDKNYNSLPILD